MRKFLIAAILLFCAAAAFRFLAAPAPQTPAASLAPDFSYETLDGKKARLHDWRGNIILLHAWASWCSPCVAEFPDLIALAKQRPDIVILAATVDDDRAALDKFLARAKDGKPLPANLIVIWDKTRSISQDLFQIYSYPETILIAPDLTLRDKIIGPASSWTDAEMAARLDALK